MGSARPDACCSVCAVLGALLFRIERLARGRVVERAVAPRPVGELPEGGIEQGEVVVDVLGSEFDDFEVS